MGKNALNKLIFGPVVVYLYGFYQFLKEASELEYLIYNKVFNQIRVFETD